MLGREAGAKAHPIERHLQLAHRPVRPLDEERRRGERLEEDAAQVDRSAAQDLAGKWSQKHFSLRPEQHHFETLVGLPEPEPEHILAALDHEALLHRRAQGSGIARGKQQRARRGLGGARRANRLLERQRAGEDRLAKGGDADRRLGELGVLADTGRPERLRSRSNGLAQRPQDWRVAHRWARRTLRAQHHGQKPNRQKEIPATAGEGGTAAGSMSVPGGPNSAR